MTQLATFGTTLSFRQGKFFIDGAPFSKREKLRVDPSWARQNDGRYVTTELRAAQVFRRFADEATEKLFHRVFQEFYFEAPDLPPLPSFLDPIQVKGVRWALSRKRSYLAHAPGAGKTCEAVVCGAYAEGDGQVLFIVPPDLVTNWERETVKFMEMMNRWPYVETVSSGKDPLRIDWEADFLIVPDSLLAKTWVYKNLYKRRFKVLAVDEASRLKEPTAERSIAFYGGRYKINTYGGLFQRARHTILLDGSPVLNRPMELWAPTYALDPEAIDCMNQDDFGYRFCGPRQTERGQYTFLGSSNEAELRERLQKTFMHVVTEDQLDHPERQRSMLFMSEDVRSREQKAWEQSSFNKYDDIGQKADQGDIARFRKELGLRKVSWIAQYVRERLEDKQESILLFAWHREVCEQLLVELSKFKPGLVIGGVPKEEREKIFARFQAGKCKLIIGNISAMGRGHNLQKTDRVIFGEFSWTDELNKQCEKRGSRRGSDKEFVRCDYIVCPDSMDEKMLGSIFTKEKRVKRIIG